MFLMIKKFYFFKLTKKMRATLSKTKFKDAPIVAVAAKPANLADDKEAAGPIGEKNIFFYFKLKFLIYFFIFRLCCYISVK